MKKLLVMIILGILMLLILMINFPLREKTVYGKYINSNYKNPICCVEAPHKPDTLILFNNGNFESDFYGKGRFKLTNGINPSIELHYMDFGKPAILRTYFYNRLFNKPRIILNPDFNHCYIKID